MSEELNPIRREVAAMPRETKILLYTFGVLEKLKGFGIIEGGCFQLSEKGDQHLAALHEEGFEPTLEELHWATETILTASERRANEEDDES